MTDPAGHMQYKPLVIAAFGALNVASYEEFAEQIALRAPAYGFAPTVSSGVAYPNAAGVSAPGRPLRAEALQDETKRQELFQAVADDARAIGAETADVRVMPCMSMIGFHAGVELKLTLPIFPLAPALAAAYKDADKVGVIHMRPAKKRVEEIFGAKAVTPVGVLAEKLQEAEETAKAQGTPEAVEDVMREIVEYWRDAKGLTRVLFARADAPRAKKSPAAAVAGVEILTYFDILAEAVLKAQAGR